MATPETGLPVPESLVQQSVLQQAQAAAAAHVDSPTRQEALLQEADLLTSDAPKDALPPPAYGDVYGEIRNEKDGLGSASVADDGRVNIRVNHFNRRLSQIFTPAPDQHVQAGPTPPAPYIPPSLGGEEGLPPPPPLNIVIQVVGSRGDVQPFVALGKVLKETYGHRVRLATHPNFKSFVQENGLEFFSIGGDPSQLMAFMVKNPGLMPGFRSLMSGDVGQRRRDVAEYIQGCWRSCYKAGDGLSVRATDDNFSEPAARPFVADCIIANPPSFAHIHCAEKLGIPLHIMFTMPYSPTQAFPHPLANIQSSNTDSNSTNYISYAMIEVLAWQGLGDIINRFRARCLGLDPVSLLWAPGMLQRLKVPHTYCWSPALIEKPPDWGSHISISGFFFLNLASNYTPALDLQTFLDAGPPPIYIGFGSIVLANPNAMTELIFEAAKKTGQRVLLSKGWGGMGADELHVPDGVFMLGNVPHDWLFKHVSCVIHHGGAGTTAAGITAGRPTLIVPFFGDQPFWGAMVARAGAGPDPIPHKMLTAENLANAIDFCLKPESLERAKELANKIAAERGSDTGAHSFHQFLEVNRLRCTLAPTRAATWRIKRTQIRLSAFAACTLANANLLDFQDLKLFRAQEYYTDDGPWDPISGGFTAACRAFSGMAMGIVDIPVERAREMYVPFSRQQSYSTNSETSHVGGKSTQPTPPEQNRTSLNDQDPLSRVRSPGVFTRSSSTSNIGSTASSDTLRRQSDSKRDIARLSSFDSSNAGGPSKDYDMLRQSSGVQTSKGFGRIVKAAVQAPMDISVSFTKGFHNLPKLWGDETVRPQEQIRDFKSGIKAVGKEFGYGFYDGVTGLVTQPWKGAQKEGTIGFLKGFGKGIGGFATKPNAAFMSVLGYTMKGVHKEVQKLLGSNVQSYIITSRVAQGYEEWLQSSDAEKEDVIVRWKLIQQYVKKKRNPDEMVEDILEAQRKKTSDDREARRNEGLPSSAQSATSAASLTQDAESAMLTMNGSQSPLRPGNTAFEASVGAAEISETIRLSVQETSRGNAEEDANVERAIQENVSQLQRNRQEASDRQAEQESLRRAITSSEAEAQRDASDAMEYEAELKRVIAQSLGELRERGSHGEWELVMGIDDEVDEFDRASKHPTNMMGKTISGSPSVQQPPPYDPEHLAGTTQGDFEPQNQGHQREKTAQEKTEEEIVLEYIKKQSLLEIHHQGKSKGRAADTDDEDLQKALELSLQGHAHDAK